MSDTQEIWVEIDGNRITRRVPKNLKHYCGLSGYNPMLGDSCEMCDQLREMSEEGREIARFRENLTKPIKIPDHAGTSKL